MDTQLLEALRTDLGQLLREHELLLANIPACGCQMRLCFPHALQWITQARHLLAVEEQERMQQEWSIKQHPGNIDAHVHWGGRWPIPEGEEFRSGAPCGENGDI